MGMLLIRTIANIVVPLYYKLSDTPALNGKHDDCLTISLTSFPARIGKVWIGIESLLRQSLRADRIVLYLSEQDFPNKGNELPTSLLRQRKCGLEIVFVEGNLKSHKKWFYAFQDPRNEFVVTVDDDIIYPCNMIEELWKAHMSNPGMGIARYGKNVGRTPVGIAPYNTWGKVKINPSASISFGSGGGISFLSEKFIRASSHGMSLWTYVLMRMTCGFTPSCVLVA